MKTEIKLDVEVLFSSNASDQLKSLNPVFEQLCRVHESYINAEPLCDFSYF